MSNIRFTMKDLDGTVMPYTSFVISTSTSANAASFTTNLNGQATVSLSAVSTPYYISKQDGTTESVIAYKFFAPDTTYTIDAELLFVDMGKISKDKNDKSIAALIEAKVVAVNAANRALQVVSLLGDVSTIRDNLDKLVQVASNIGNIDAVVTNETNINTVAGNTTNINKVATIDTSVTTVANSQTNVNIVATNIANVNNIAPHTANIGTVATNVGSVNTVAGSSASINTTASNIANVNTVAGNTSSISTVAGISPAVTTVANNIADIQTTAEGIGLIPDVLPYTSNITTVANNIAPIVAVGNNINNINEVRAMEADIEVLADEIANIAGAAAAVTQAVDAQKVLYVAGTDYTKNTSNTLVLPYFPAKSNSVKIFFDGTYKNKDAWNRVGKNIAFTTAINADKVEIQYEVPSSFVGLSPEDILVIQNAEAAALASEVDAQQSATAAAVSASLAQGVANQAIDAIKQLFVAGTGFTKGVSTQLTMDFLPVKTNAVKVFFDGIYQNKDTFTRVGKVITFSEALDVDTVEIHYEVPSQFVGLDEDDNAVLVAAQNAAQASANAAAASFDSFDDRYLGVKTVAPTLDNDGNTLLVGAKYFNSTESKMYVRNSSNAWQLDTADSGSVNYLPAGTGAVARTVQDKLRDFVSVKDFGAAGDWNGTTGADDTASIQKALDTSLNVFFPPGRYLVSKALRLRYGHVVRGATQRDTFINRVNTTPETIDGISVCSIFYLPAVGDIHISNFGIRGDGVSGSASLVDGVRSYGEYRSSISNMDISFCRNALYMRQPWLCKYENIRAVNIYDTAFNFSEAYAKTSLHFNNCVAENTGNGYVLTYADYSTMTSCGADYVNYTSTSNPYGFGFGNRASTNAVYQFNGGQVTLSGCGSENSYGNGFIGAADDQATHLVVNACTCYVLKSEYVPPVSHGVGWAVGAFQMGRGPSTLTLNGGSYSFTNTAAPVVAGLVAFNYDAGTYGIKKGALVVINGISIASEPFAGRGDIQFYCRNAQNVQNQFTKQLSGSISTITIPIASQGDRRYAHYINIKCVSNSSTSNVASFTEAGVEFTSLNNILGLAQVESKNVASVAVSGMNVVITLTSPVTSPKLLIQMVSVNPKLVLWDEITAV